MGVLLLFYIFGPDWERLRLQSFHMFDPDVGHPSSRDDDHGQQPCSTRQSSPADSLPGDDVVEQPNGEDRLDYASRSTRNHVSDWGSDFYGEKPSETYEEADHTLSGQIHSWRDAPL